MVTGVCWGHDTDVLEDRVRDFAENWAGTGSIENTGDLERLALGSGEYMQSETVRTGAVSVSILQNVYRAADTVTLKYRHGSTQAECESASWVLYSAPFTSLGFVQVRVEATG